MFRCGQFATALRAGLVAAACVVLLPSLGYAQTTLAGTVTDASGAVLPGVTVEASSPVLIEKVRTVTTDGSGQYRIIDLRPGTYRLSFTLQGFTNVVREAVDVGGGSIAINAELRLGGVQETITVTGETPVVDVQSTRRVATVDSQTLSTLPMARGYGNLLAAVPGIQLNTATSQTGIASSFFTSNGGRNNEGRIQIAGMNVGSAFNGGGVAAFSYDVANAQEVQVTVSGGLGESDTGGPAMNLIPREGGNTFRGTVFLSEAGKWSQGNNVEGLGIAQPAGLVRNWDESFALGGPIVRDRVWFFALARDNGSVTRVLSNGQTTFPNLNAGNPNSWVYAPDMSVEERGATSARQVAFRLTGQITPRNKIGFYHDYNWDCWSSSYIQGEGCRPRGDDWVALGSANGAPETGTGWDGREKIIQATYSSTVTNKLLLEGGYSTFISAWGGFPVAGSLLDFIPVTEQSNYYGVANFNYRGISNYTHNDQRPNVWRGSLSYVTGSHNIKIGNQGAYHMATTIGDTAGTRQTAYTFNSLCQLPGEAAPVAPGPGVRPCTAALGGTITPRPTQVTTWIPNTTDDRTTFQAFYIQDSWTMNRFTVNGALRYEWAKSWAPEGKNGVFANLYTPAILDPKTDGVTGYHDLSPRVGVAWDVFGTGKTAVRLNLGHYLQSANNEANYTINNPATGRQRTQARTWTDRDGDFVPDCDLSPGATGVQDGVDFCGAVSGASLNFGSVVRTRTVNPDVLHGWGKRPYDWVFGASIQQEIIPRLSVEVAYNRRTWGNFFVDDNLNLSPSDFSTITLTAPQHPLLPNGGGYPYAFRVPRVSAATNNYYTFASDYGDQTAKFDSVQFTSRARTSWGLTLQGGTTTGRGVRDQCEVEAQLPEIVGQGGVGRADNCRVEEPWLTSLNGLASYTVPKVDVLVSAIIRSQPGTGAGAVVGSIGGSQAANLNLTNLQIFNASGSNLILCGTQAPAACTTTQSINLLRAGEVYQDRINSFDMRFAKILRFGGRRADIGIDLYNVINANATSVYNTQYGADGSGLWQPQQVQGARFARFNVTFDF